MFAPPSRRVPQVGMPVRIAYLGCVEDGVISDVEDGGRAVTVAGQRFTLRRLTGHYVREGEPYYGTRLLLKLTEALRAS